MRTERKDRITLDMSIVDVFHAISEGNPGALRVCMELFERAASIDPDSVMGGLGALLNLDSRGIYGSRVWMFYKNVCGCDPAKLLALLRAVQLGLGLTDAALNHAIDNRGDGIDVDALVAAVKARLPRLGQAAAEVTP